MTTFVLLTVMLALLWNRKKLMPARIEVRAKEERSRKR